GADAVEIATSQSPGGAIETAASGRIPANLALQALPRRSSAREQPVAGRSPMTILEKVGPVPSPIGGATALYDWDEPVQDARVHRLIYADPPIFAGEMVHVFGGTWVSLAHESQIPANNDFITGRLGLRPLIIVRDMNGAIRALYNRCTHRGTTLCRWDKGNSRSFQCPYHGWNFLNTAKLRGVPWPEG